MSINERTKEERQRLGLSQTAFAALAGVTKSAQIKWEGGNSSAPTAPALAAWAEAGADVLYILTGRRAADRGDNAPSQIEDQLAGIRRDLLDPADVTLPGETIEAAEERVLNSARAQLSAMLRYDTTFVSDSVREEIERLLDAATNPAALALYRAADLMQRRARRRELKDRIAGWFDQQPYGETAANLLATLAVDYAVPVKFLVELIEELRDDFGSVRGVGQMEPSR